MCKERDTIVIPELPEGGSLGFLYETTLGRLILKLLICPVFSKLGGAFMNTRLSTKMIPRFIRKNGIDMARYEEGPFSCYNAFFSRKMKEEPDMSPSGLMSPCDSKLTVYPIDEKGTYNIKGTPYTIGQLLDNESLARQFDGGYCMIFRLTVDDYHRYCYLDDGTKGQNFFIPGKLHTVQPIAFRRYNVYKENCREYTVMETAHFGTVVQVEVGALMVGKICNHHEKHTFQKGQEKGMFQFGGSTIVVLLRKDAAIIDREILENTENQRETIVKIGEQIGRAEEK